ncbi:hypothetical protein AAHN93_14540 [Vandammella animalimorsus]|uniref:hypothetical protein n=1 Tax=Vandammella animalimorsus TaxID=2029117 RepID=UPI0031BB0DAD
MSSAPITLQAQVQLTPGQARGVAIRVLIELLSGGEAIEHGLLLADDGRGLHSPTLAPLRRATDLDRAALLVLQHLAQIKP